MAGRRMCSWYLIGNHDPQFLVLNAASGKRRNRSRKNSRGDRGVYLDHGLEEVATCAAEIVSHWLICWEEGESLAELTKNPDIGEII